MEIANSPSCDSAESKTASYSEEAVSRHVGSPLQAGNGKGPFDLPCQLMPGPGAQQPTQDVGWPEVELSVGPVEKLMELLGRHRGGHVRRSLVIQDSG